MSRSRRCQIGIRIALVLGLAWYLPLNLGAQTGPAPCSAEQPNPLLPKDPARCAALREIVRHPSALPLDVYEAKLGAFLRAFCHRDAAGGWRRDKRMRDVGPYIATLGGGRWTGHPYGTHEPVVIWYSPEMLAWMHENRPAEEVHAPADPTPVPDGAIMVKEMFSPPAAACAGVDPSRLLPTSGAAVMVRDAQASADGWFWGWFGWSGWDPDWPAGPNNRLPYMGFGQYCVNCHASAKHDLTFASLRNVEGEEGEPLVFLSQSFFDTPAEEGHHRLVSLPDDDALRLGMPRYSQNLSFTEEIQAQPLPKPSWDTVVAMPSETYDNVWAQAGGASAASSFLTSDQCVGCHDAGATGLQFDMTLPNPHGDNLLNLSPYATWRSSPMGLGGRDPIFYAQLASETETFHKEVAPVVQDTCLGCHGIMGQRQYAIDGADSTSVPCEAKTRPEERHRCFLRAFVEAAPWPAETQQAHLASYAALARDGISCTACHHMLVGKGGEDPAIHAPENRGVAARQGFLNPGNKGFASTFTGSFLVGPPGELYGPFEDPKTKPMDHALGIQPVHDTAIRSSELCGTCHTVHLPVMEQGEIIDYTYEQTTYPEWAFSDYRTGDTPNGPLPSGAGARAESCQGCHMPSRDAQGVAFSSKIAGIQEYSNFPQAEYNLGPEDLDLAVREGFARHTLVGLNVFFIKMAQQFPDVLGIRTQDPMLVTRGLDPLLLTEQRMLDQASSRTATVTVGAVERDEQMLRAQVRIDSEVGHKFPSGVGFRRAFITFEVLDAVGHVLWASGRSNDVGMLVDEQGDPVAGELWWRDDCSARRSGEPHRYQPHYQSIDAQDQVQIYQELVTGPKPGPGQAVCGHTAKPDGPLTTSFLSICGHLKDNRILPHGFLGLSERTEIAEALGAGADLAEDSGPTAVGEDPDYQTGGGDSLSYEVPLDQLQGTPATVRATLNYQAIPPYFLQDRFCTAKSADTQRLYFLASHLNLEGTEAQGWKLAVTSSGEVPVP